MRRILAHAYGDIVLVFAFGLVLSLLAACSVRLIFHQAPLGDLITALLTLFAVPIGVVIAGHKPDQNRGYLIPAAMILSVCWTLAIVGLIVVFDVTAYSYRTHPIDCPCSLSSLTEIFSNGFEKANGILSLVLGALFVSNSASSNTSGKG